MFTNRNSFFRNNLRNEMEKDNLLSSSKVLQVRLDSQVMPGWDTSWGTLHSEIREVGNITVVK